MSATPGLTKDAGWELGVRRTVPVPLDAVWDYLLGDGLALWLGAAELGTRKGDAYVTGHGVRGELRSRTERVRVRLTWRPPDWTHDSTLQITVSPAATGTTIGIHQDRLASASERELMLAHWREVAERIAAALSPG
ncbi:SRPBCC domain-containing protein [Microbispora corallina]|uniref:Activator of Hsp90 ATPase homologue 1/2-like C-terminal domain-containing protein n=1 Tax=Microbispora corallina TaxID=83302 RepID=A0ABQ4FYA0_9ACTN|nr:SRPBCC domain-containing protein [Microbispora corallina]GIH39771.1 hypothetical protein Mco01_27710 [Microbispora corallina]